MKKFLILCLLCLSSINCLTAARDFITAFYNGYKGTTIVLDDKCFGEDFDQQVAKIKELIAERKYDELAVALLKIESDLWNSCATDELVAIIDRFDQKIKKIILSLNSRLIIIKFQYIFLLNSSNMLIYLLRCLIR